MNTYIGLNRNSPFPILLNDTAMREALADREEIRFMKQENGTTVCSYIVASAETFRDSYSREARGVVFDSTGQTIARPLHKFFNVNERLETQAVDLDWTKVSRVMFKRDGSMIHTVALHEDDRNFTVKSKKSYSSDVAVQAKKWLLQRENYVKFCSSIVACGLTAIFEWTSPTARIVVGYKKDSLDLLHVRENTSGNYLSQWELESLSKTFDIPLVEKVPTFSVDQFASLVADTEDIEGWVIQFENGDMVKLKTKWYMDRHQAMTFLRTRDIAKMVINESLDDLKAKLVGDGIDISQILEIEQKVVDAIQAIESELNELFTTTAGLDRKTVAMSNQGHKYFGLLMQKYSGKEPDVPAYFAKTKLDEMFDLTQLNLVDSVAEVEE